MNFSSADEVRSYIQANMQQAQIYNSSDISKYGSQDIRGIDGQPVQKSGQV